jgi:uncharacterized protein YifE (UPF0438 family)
MAVRRTARSTSPLGLTTIRQLIERAGLHISETEFEQIVLRVAGRGSPTADASDATHEFDPATRAALERSGADFTPLASGATDPVARTQAGFVALLADALTVDEAATSLHRDVSRIRQRVRDGSLLAVRDEDGTHLPRAQFDDDGREIPGMADVLRAVPSGLHPVAVVTWLTRPDPDLRLAGEPVSPREWLRSGGTAEPVAELAADLLIA